MKPVPTSGPRAASAGPARAVSWFAIVSACLCLASFARPAGASVPAPAGVEVQREHLFFTLGPAGAHVLHLIDLVNRGVEPAASLPLPVPAQARLDSIPDGLTLEAGTIVDSSPLEPGESRQYALAYQLPWREPMAIRRALIYPTRELLIWAEEGAIDVEGLHLDFLGQREFEGMTFSAYRMERLDPHPNWQVVLRRTGIPAGELPLLMDPVIVSDPAAMLATSPLSRLFLAAAAVAGAAWLYRRAARRGESRLRSRPGARASARHVQEVAGHAQTAAAELKEEIVRLDLAFRAGELDEDTYRQERAKLKAELLTIVGEREGWP
ncbi:MAG: hypothetical protein H0Z37_05885 [Firmicutes bacterium]|nr:hypothetical protein [Bacillota bacterium]